MPMTGFEMIGGGFVEGAYDRRSVRFRAGGQLVVHALTDSQPTCRAAPDQLVLTGREWRDVHEGMARCTRCLSIFPLDPIDTPPASSMSLEDTRSMQHDWGREWPPERLAAFARAESARYLDPYEIVRVATPEGASAITARTIIEIGGEFLVESVDQPNDWYIGGRVADGAIVCWGRYGDIEAALRSL